MTHTEYMRIWREKNREKYKAIVRKAGAKWRKNNPDKVKEKTKAEHNLERFEGKREIVLNRDSYKCVLCESRTFLSVDHIDGNRKNNSIMNLQTLCLKCHGHKDGIRGWKRISPTFCVRVVSL